MGMPGVLAHNVIYVCLILGTFVLVIHAIDFSRFVPSKNVVDVLEADQAGQDAGLHRFGSRRSLPSLRGTPSPNLYRLPSTLKPLHYDVRLKPDIYTRNSTFFSFEGSVTIRFRCENKTGVITLHSLDLSIVNNLTRLWTGDNVSDIPKVENITYYKKTQFLIFSLSTDLLVGVEYFLFVSFKAPLKENGVGLYYTSYKNRNDVIYLATSKMEPTFARRAFPCFDEPAMKSTFNVVILRRNDTVRQYRSFSNTVRVGVEHTSEPGYVADIFNTTPPMSTYLLSFLVCDFSILENRTRSGVLYRTVVRPNAIEEGRVAQKKGVEIFQWLQDFLDIPYPVRKLDGVATPHFKFGGMENWGMVSYMEDLVLYKPGVSPPDSEVDLVEVVAHETAHMWFGDIVTPKWWNCLWLSEGFASFFDFYVTQQLYPDLRPTEEFIANSMHEMLELDTHIYSHPLTSGTLTSLEISSIFDGITYTKGAAIIRMMQHVLGDDTFKKGLRLYLNRNKYGAVDHYDLLEALTEQAQREDRSINMTEIMDPWITQAHFPIVHVNRTGNGRIRVGQELFPVVEKEGSSSYALYGYRWTIPITYTSSKDPNFSKYYRHETITFLNTTQREASITDTDIIPDQSDPNSWVLVNVQQHGFYRVNYDHDNWQALVNQLKVNHTVIHPINRGQIINDAWCFGKVGLLDKTIALQITEYLQQELDYVPWTAFHRELDTFHIILKMTDLHPLFEKFMRRILKMPFTTYGMFKRGMETPLERQTRSIITEHACSYGLPECVKASKELYETWMLNVSHSSRPYHSDSFPSDLKSVVYCTAIREGGEGDWEFAYRQYKRRLDSELMRGLTCTRDKERLRRLLEMLSSGYDLPPRVVLEGMSTNEAGRDMAWQFFKDNYMELKERFPSSMISEMINSITITFNSEEDQNDVQDFVTSKEITDFRDKFNWVAARTQHNIIWLRNNYEIFRKWLHDQDL